MSESWELLVTGWCFSSQAAAMVSVRLPGVTGLCSQRLPLLFILSFALLNTALNQWSPSLGEWEQSGKVWQAPVLCLSLYEWNQGVVEMSVRKFTPAVQTLRSDLHLVWIMALEVEWEKNHLGNLCLASAKSAANAPGLRTPAGLNRRQLYCAWIAVTPEKCKLCTILCYSECIFWDCLNCIRLTTCTFH